MEKKFSVVISPASEDYAVVLRCYIINEEGEQVTVAQSVTAEADIDAAITLTEAFIQNNK
jgi:hypothetical protein